MMKYYFVRFSADYADEFDIGGCFVTTRSPEDFFEEALENSIEYFDGFPCDRYFGTNEFITYESLEDYKRCFNFQECSKEFYEEFQRLNPYWVGVFALIE